MGLDDMVNKAKETLGGGDAAASAVDQAAEAAKGVAPDQAHGAVDAAADKAKEMLGGDAPA